MRKGIQHKHSFSSPRATFTSSTPPDSNNKDKEQGKKWGLTKNTKRQLILDIEERGGLGICVLKRLCDEKPHLYGQSPDCALRRKVQNKVAKWKNLSAADFQAEKLNLFAGVDYQSREESLIPKPTRSVPVGKSPSKQTPTQGTFPFHTRSTSLSPYQTSKMNAPWSDIRFGPGKLFSFSTEINIKSGQKFLIPCTENTVHVDISSPEKHREFLLVPFQDYPSGGILYNGFGVEISGGDFGNYREGRYRAWLKSSHEIVLQLPVARSTLLTQHGINSYQAQRQRLGGHSETYEVARMVVRNRIQAQGARHVYYLLIVFPAEFELTNAVFTPNNSPYGEITPQITPVEVSNPIDEQRCIRGIEVDIAFGVTIIEEEPRRAIAGTSSNPHADALANALNGMKFGS